MIKDTSIGQEIMKDLKKISFNKDYLIEVDPEDLLNYEKMEIVAKSHTYTDGYIKFDEELKAANRLQVSLQGDSFLTYSKLDMLLTERLKAQIARHDL